MVNYPMKTSAHRSYKRTIMSQYHCEWTVIKRQIPQLQLHQHLAVERLCRLCAQRGISLRSLELIWTSFIHLEGNYCRYLLQPALRPSYGISFPSSLLSTDSELKGLFPQCVFVYNVDLDLCGYTIAHDTFALCCRISCFIEYTYIPCRENMMFTVFYKMDSIRMLYFLHNADSHCW